jgi:signal transduction histidine kinase/ligand-binding sensor domain-containing protein/DNA-binding response OmpR family regulator
LYTNDPHLTSVRSYTLLIILIAQALFCEGQYHRIKFRHFGTTNGLSQSNVTAILQDQQGFIWLGTQDGLNRYDGYSFTVFKNNPSDPHTLTNNYIKDLKQAKDGKIWIGTWGGGLCLLNPATGSFSPFAPGKIPDDFISHVILGHFDDLWISTESHGVYHVYPSLNRVQHIGTSTDINDIHLDKMGRVWLASSESGLGCYDPVSGRLLWYSHHTKDSTSIGSDNILRIFEDQHGTFWLSAVGEGLDAFNPATGKSAHFPYSTTFSHNLIRDLGEDSFHHIWIGTENAGLYILDPHTRKFTQYLTDDIDNNSLSNNSIYSIFQDVHHGMWVGTYSGGVNLYNLDVSQFLLYRHSTAESSLSNNDVLTFFETPGKMWVGTDGGGLDVMDEATGAFQHFARGSLPSRYILALGADQKQQLWVGTVGDGTAVYDKSGRLLHIYHHHNSQSGSPSGDNVSAIAVGPDHSVWLATYRDGLDRYNEDKRQFEHFHHDSSNPAGLSSDRIQLLRFDSKGLLWIATFDKGIDLFNPNNHQFAHLVHDPDSTHSSLSNNDVNDIIEDHKGDMWIATNYGLNHWNRKTGKFIRYLSRDGLGGNIIHALLEDRHNRLWMSTDGGITCLDPETGSCNNFTTAYGLQSGEYKAHAAWKDASGKFYFGGTGGFNAFYPDSIHKRSFDPPLVLTRFSLFNHEVSMAGSDSGTARFQADSNWNRKIVLPYDHSVLTFDFASLNYTTADKKHYSYMLDGFEKSWNQAGTRHSVTYTNLDPGGYTLLVKGMDDYGNWSPQMLSVHILIKPPFWTTLWFKILLVVSIAVGLYLIYSIRTRLLRRQQRHLEEEVQVRTEQLNRSVEKEKEANEAKSIFLAMMSHEIRTPLNGIIGMSNLLSDSHLNKEQQEYAVTIQQCGETLMSVINDILDFSKIESGHMELERADFYLDDCIEEVLDLFAPKAGMAGIDLISEMDDEVPRLINGDKVRLRQVLMNLVSNAVKFTRKGDVFIHVGAGKPVPEKGMELIFTVQDTGIGIPADKLHRLFKAFSQVDASTTRQFGGTGLGLVICDKLVHLMGGEISVESTEGKGTAFQFTIIAGEAGPADIPESIGPLRELAGKQVLIVDDNLTNLRILNKQLEKWGLRTSATSSPEEALTWIEYGRSFDLVLTDMNMPGLTGTSLAKRIHAKVPLVPIVLLSSSWDELSTDKEDMFKAILHKPARQQQLLGTLMELLQEKGPRTETIAPPQRHIDPEFADRNPHRILVAEDNLVNQKLIGHILTKLGYAPDMASNGKEAVERSRLTAYDLILMDVSMPELDGLQATKVIRSEEGSQPVIVAMTANAMEGDRQACLDAGMDDYLSKPLQLDQLLTVLEKGSK